MDPRRIIVGGHDFPCNAEVSTWHEHKLQFKPGLGARRRNPKKTPIDLFVTHVTGGENPPPVLFDVLLGRKDAHGKPTPLGVEFMIDVDGLIWQTCDPYFVDTFDASFINDRSVGVEIVNYGYVKPGVAPPKRGANRELYETIIHGEKVTMARSNNAQHAAYLALADALTACELLRIPRRIPRDPSGCLITQVMTREQIANYTGVIGHKDITTQKLDPGTDVMSTLDFAGYA